MKRLISSTISHILLLTGALSVALFQPALHASPYASCITNNNGTITFHLNESGGNVVVTFEDGSTNANFNGFTTGVNLALGAYSFNLGSHTTYSIAVSKTGSGVTAYTGNSFVEGNLRGIDVNKNPTSPYFGVVYFDRAAPNLTSQQYLWAMNSDLSLIRSNTGAITTWQNNSANGPYRLAIGTDDSIIVGDCSPNNAGVFLISPDFSTGQVLLGPPGDVPGGGVHGLVPSRPLVLGNITSGNPVTLLTVDGDMETPPYPILVYSNITLASLPWQNPPTGVGPEVSVDYAGIGTQIYPGLVQGPNGYIYTSNYRNNLSNPDLFILDASGTNIIWTSWHTNGATLKDYFVTDGGDGAGAEGPVDCAVSPDGKYIATVHDRGHLTICSLTNGIPDPTTMYTVAAPTYSVNGYASGICWDAADNIYTVSTYYQPYLYEYSLGKSTKCVTTGTAAGTTAFNLSYLSANISVYATNNGVISTANSHGNPTSGYFTIARSCGNISQPLTVGFSYSGTATNGTYTTGSASGVVFAAGQTVTNISINAVSDGVARLTTALTLTVSNSPNYSIYLGSATIAILNAATPTLVASVNVPTMYNAFSNDYAAFTVTRLGDTNVAAITANYALTGSAVAGTDYTTPTPVTFNPGDVTKASYVYPLIAGQPPVHSAAKPFVGNKIIGAGMASGTGYVPAANVASLTILDSAYPPATVLYSNSLASASDAANWNICAANANMANVPVDIYGTQFGQDLTQTPYYAVPFPPNGSQYALMETVNKTSGAGLVGGPPTVVNAYLTNQVFGGNYAVRFNMNMIEGGNLYESTADYAYDSEEGTLFGINHNGTETNFWVTGSDLLSGGGLQSGAPWASDGVFYWISDSGGSYLETWPNYQIFTGNGSPATNTGWAQPLAGEMASTFANAFKTNIYTTPISTFVSPYDSGWTEGGPGLPANGSAQYGLSVSSWADVEIKQLNGVVTMSINKTPIYVYTNATMFTSGCIMLGYEDPWDGGEDNDAAVYYSNLQVVRIGAPAIANIGTSGGNIVMNFSITDSGGSLSVQSASAVNGPYNTVAATITPLGGGAYQATVPKSGSVQFYRISQQ